MGGWILYLLLAGPGWEMPMPPIDVPIMIKGHAEVDIDDCRAFLAVQTIDWALRKVRVKDSQCAPKSNPTAGRKAEPRGTSPAGAK